MGTWHVWLECRGKFNFEHKSQAQFQKRKKKEKWYSKKKKISPIPKGPHWAKRRQETDLAAWLTGSREHCEQRVHAPCRSPPASWRTISSPSVSSSAADGRKMMEASPVMEYAPDIDIAMARAQQRVRLVSVDGRDDLLAAAHQDWLWLIQMYSVFFRKRIICTGCKSLHAPS